MRKIPSVFCRNRGDGDRLVRDEVVLGCEWVMAGVGVATVKWDGTSCLVRNGALYKRYDAKHGKTPPLDFMPAMEPDPITGHWAGWVPCRAGDPASRYHVEAFGPQPDGTYELIGPKVGGNPHHVPVHLLVPHGLGQLTAWPRSFGGLRQGFLNCLMFEFPEPRPLDALTPYGASFAFEGVVFHHPDGRMAKVKRKDFGLPWPVQGVV